MIPPPPGLYPKDRLMRALVPITGVYERLSRRGARRQPPVRRVDRTLRLVVDRVVAEAEDVVSLRLVDPAGTALPRWQPGCHVDLLLPSGARRQYSLCGDPADRTGYRIAVRRIADGDGGSREVHDTLRAGSAVSVQGPRNAFPFLELPSYLFLAGGIGITPILPMVRAARALGADWRLVYTGRSRASMPFLDELPGDRVVLRPDDEFGVPDPAELLGFPGATVYCCGPPPMIDGVRAALGRDRPLHFERFSPPPVVGGEPFSVRLARTGVTVPVGARQSALAAIREVLPTVAYSCQQGFCGTCRTPVLPGGEMAICRDRGRGLVVLDL